MKPIPVTPIGVLYSIYKEKFGIPRQARLVEAPGTLEFYPEFAREEAVRGLEQFSHLWLLFYFHASGKADSGSEKAPSWSPMVRPPRLGGNKKIGVFASRSPFRPSRIGMSAVRLDAIDISSKGPVLHLSGVDILDGTPVLDIKPYLPYSDCIPEAKDAFATSPPLDRLDIFFSQKALTQIDRRKDQEPQLRTLIEGILKTDPRPAYCSGSNNHPHAGRIYGMRIYDFDLQWTLEENTIHVIELRPVDENR